MEANDPKTDPHDDGLPPLSPAEEAEMQREIEVAIEPYRRITPPKLLATMRANLEHALRTHPDARQYLRAFTPRGNVVVSGDGPIAGAPTETAAPSSDKAGWGRGASVGRRKQSLGGSCQRAAYSIASANLSPRH